MRLGASGMGQRGEEPLRRARGDEHHPGGREHPRERPGRQRGARPLQADDGRDDGPLVVVVAGGPEGVIDRGRPRRRQQRERIDRLQAHDRARVAGERHQGVADADVPAVGGAERGRDPPADGEGGVIGQGEQRLAGGRRLLPRGDGLERGAEDGVVLVGAQEGGERLDVHPGLVRRGHPTPIGADGGTLERHAPPTPC